MFRKIVEILDDETRIKRRYKKDVEAVISLEDRMKKLTDAELQSYTKKFKNEIAEGKTVEDIKIEAMAVVREAARRVRGEFPYAVQILGAMIINGGDIAEMKTGEGKTLTATMPVYLNALTGNGVHVVTVNEYLSERDATEMGQIYEFLGLTVGVNKAGLSNEEKKAAYACDITYTTNSELGFDYLRDNMVHNIDDKVMRGLEYALIDEADSILIDESRTPLIISGHNNSTIEQFTEPDKAVKNMKRGIHFEVDEKDKSVYLLPEGVSLIEKGFNVENLYDIKYSLLVHRINNALKANYIMQKDVDYLITDTGEIVIIDQFTGRIMEGRAYSDGLHQAIEAKEGVKIRPEAQTVATITYQNFFRLYNKLAGMTGTAKTEEEEFMSIYNMRVIRVDTNKPIRRFDLPDYIYPTKEDKYKGLIDGIKLVHATGQPILIGTISVETNELLSKLLTKEKIAHEVLNAKNHLREAEIIAKAGQVGAVTIATNMAGRGTDIKLSDEARRLGGLAVLGTERHESRRIDNQLRGRSGRQGDPGFSRFYVSLEDDLMKRFGSEFLQESIKTVKGEPIESKIVTKAISSAQKRVEGQNFDIRKQLIEYDDVLRQQREIVYDYRNKLLSSDNVHKIGQKMYKNSMYRLVGKCFDTCGKLDEDKFRLVLTNNSLAGIKLLRNKDFSQFTKEEIQANLYEQAWEMYCEKTRVVGDSLLEIERDLLIQIIDEKWQSHIDTMTRLRNCIHLRSYAQNNPLQAYISEGFELFNDMIIEIEDTFSILLSNVVVTINKTEENTEEKLVESE